MSGCGGTLFAVPEIRGGDATKGKFLPGFTLRGNPGYYASAAAQPTQPSKGDEHMPSRPHNTLRAALLAGAPCWQPAAVRGRGHAGAARQSGAQQLADEPPHL